MKRPIPATLALLLIIATAAFAAEPLANVANPQAVADVLAGKETTANAAWWGFDPEDATTALQGAIDSGAKRVIVPKMESDWIVRPITLAGDQELIFEKGVVVTAKRGEYRARNDSVFSARNVSNLVIKGDGATIRMQKEDYIVGKVLSDLGWKRWFGPYEKAEWRMALSLRGCTNVKVQGLTLRDSGGDGIYVAGTKKGPSKEIEIKGVVCDNNYRQGISVIDVDGLVVEDSVFRNTWGTPPSSGVDFEPDGAKEGIRNVVFRRCRFEDNYGDGIQVHLPHTAQDVSILFDDCFVTSSRGAGIRVSKVKDGGPQGLIEFRNCRVENTVAYGIKVQDKSTQAVKIRFDRCTLRGVARERQYAGAWAPIWLQSKPPFTLGGIEFIDCIVEDDRERPAIVVDGPSAPAEITGTLTIRNPRAPKSDLGPGIRIVAE